MKKRILFVDDEPNILSSMKRMLRSLRKTAILNFVEGGRAALLAMEEEPYDVVISDMRMPGMDGAELLATICKKWPQTIRIMLTGQADSDSLLRTVNVVHQFLMKPCEHDEIKQTIDRACRVHSFLQDGGPLADAGRALVEEFVLPDIYQQLQQVLLADNCSLEALTDCLQQDSWVSENMVEMFQFSGSICDSSSLVLHEAIADFGFDVLRSLVLSLYLFKLFQQCNISHELLHGVMSHGMRVGQYAKQIAMAEEAKPSLLAEALIGGLLHDIGYLLIAQNQPEKCQQVFAELLDNGERFDSREGELVSFSHNRAGALLLVMLGFPLGIIEVVAFHNELSGDTGSGFNGVTAVHVADSTGGSTDNASLCFGSSLSEEYVQQVGCLERLPVWQNLILNDG